MTRSKTDLLAKGIKNALTRNELKNINLGITKLDKIAKRLGVDGLVLQGGVLANKYFNGEGITKKDVFAGIVSGVLFAITITNPIALIAVGAYGLLDAVGAIDGIKDAISANDDVILKR